VHTNGTIKKQPHQVLVSSQNRRISSWLKKLLRQSNFSAQEIQVSPLSPHQVFKRLPDLIILDWDEPDENLALCESLRFFSQSDFVPILILSSYEKLFKQAPSWKACCDDILYKPLVDYRVLDRIRALLSLKGLGQDANGTYAGMHMLTHVLESREPFTMGHGYRVAYYAVKLAKMLKLSAREIETLYIAAMFHDVGKIVVPESILRKPSRFDPPEYEIMKNHPSLGAELARHWHLSPEMVRIIRGHHERLDGTGYPFGLSRKTIPLLSRVVTIVDIYDALRSRRCYKEAYPKKQSLEIMFEEAQLGWWDKDILSIWERCIAEVLPV